MLLNSVLPFSVAFKLCYLIITSFNHGPNLSENYDCTCCETKKAAEYNSFMEVCHSSVEMWCACLTYLGKLQKCAEIDKFSKET